MKRLTTNDTNHMFWLTNCRPDRWKYNPEPAGADESEGSGVVVIPEVSGGG